MRATAGAFLLLATLLGAYQTTGSVGVAFFQLLGAGAHDATDPRRVFGGTVELPPTLEVVDGSTLVSNAPSQGASSDKKSLQARGFVLDIMGLYPEIRFDDGASLCTMKKDNNLKRMLAPIFQAVVNGEVRVWVWEPMGEPRKVMDAISELLRDCPGR